MNPYPFWLLNHFTLPCATVFPSCRLPLTAPDDLRKRRCCLRLNDQRARGRYHGRLGELGALLAYALDVAHRRIGMVNLGVAFPERPLRERRGILRRSFLNLGRMAAELAHLPRLSDERLRDMVRFEDEAWWQQAVGWERSTGVFVLSGHFGNWELLAFAHGRRGYPVHMVHRAIANPVVDRWLCEFRRR